MRQTSVNSRRRRPELETCEPRTLLATTGPLTIAALGDSLTDEYQFYSPDRPAAMNWVEILSQARSSQVNLGAFTTQDRGETRNQGYAQDWARSGATSAGPDVSGAGTTFLEQYNGGFASGLPGLVNPPSNLANVDAVTILIGGNDYVRALETAVAMGTTDIPTFEFNLLDQLQTANTNIVVGVAGAVSAIHVVNPTLPIIVLTTPDVTDTPLFQNTVNSAAPTPADAKALTDLVVSFDRALTTSLIQNFGNLPAVDVVNVDTILHDFIVNPYIDGVFVNPKEGGPLYTDLFVGDSFHPGTIGQSKLANAIIGALDTFYPGRVTPLSDSEIVDIARAAQPVTHATLSSFSVSTDPGTPVTLSVSIPSFPSFSRAFNQGTYPAPTGSVTYVDASQGNRILGIATLNNLDLNGPSVASLTVSDLGPGAHQIIAMYSGDTVYPSTVTESVNQFVGTTKQVQLIQLVQLYQTELGRQVGPPLLARWTHFLNRGHSPRIIARTIYHRVGQWTHLPRVNMAQATRAEVHASLVAQRTAAHAAHLAALSRTARGSR